MRVSSESDRGALQTLYVGKGRTARGRHQEHSVTLRFRALTP